MGGGHHLLPPDPEKKKKKKDATSARATLGRPVGWRGRPHGRHPAAGQGLSGASASSLLSNAPLPAPSFGSRV